MPTDLDSRPASVAQYPVSLSLPDASGDLVSTAADAVRREYRNSVKWKRLRCRGVSSIQKSVDKAIFVLEIGQSIEFDWTWEGAVAFKPKNADAFIRDAESTEAFLAEEEASEDNVWSGEIVEVDETIGRIFVWVNDPESPPTTGSFYVRPFEFLAFLNAIYCDSGFSEFRDLLPPRLNATRGNVHPIADAVVGGGLPQLREMWRHGWSALWGPPGTGKTHTIGRQVASLLSDPAERILVVSTTNKATDGAALSIGVAGRSTEPCNSAPRTVLRIGKGADHERFEQKGLADILKGTETDILRQIAILTKQLHKAMNHEERAVIRKQAQALRRQMKDASYSVFVSRDVRVVVATAFKAMTMLNNANIRSIVCKCAAPFSTIIIDEAGLISRAVAAPLSLLASRRVLMVGDPKQLAPISRVSRILPTAQATWLASSGLSHLTTLKQPHSAVHLLLEQHRMHPQVCSVVSAFQYERKLRDAPGLLERRAALPLFMSEQPRSIWYVLDEDGDDLPSIRAERGPGNKSWMRPKTRSVLEKLFSDKETRRTRGLFITPFVAQARDIRSFFHDSEIDSWSAATVHSQQGAEADYVIFDTVNAGSCGWPYDE